MPRSTFTWKMFCDDGIEFEYPSNARAYSYAISAASREYFIEPKGQKELPTLGQILLIYSDEGSFLRSIEYRMIPEDLEAVGATVLSHSKEPNLTDVCYEIHQPNGYTWLRLQKVGACWLHINILGAGRFADFESIWQRVVGSIKVKTQK